MNVCASLLVCVCVSWVSMHSSVSLCRQDQVAWAGGRGADWPMWLHQVLPGCWERVV